MSKQREAEVASMRRERVLEFLKAMTQPLNSSQIKKRSVADLLLEEGLFWDSQERPDGTALAEPKMGFCNAMRLAWSDPARLTCCEGYAFPEDLDLPIEHAWCVDKAGRVIDNTWKHPEFSVYFGIPFSLAYVSGALEKKRTFGVLFDYMTGRDLLFRSAVTWSEARHFPDI